jgi:hypothetical protein
MLRGRYLIAFPSILLFASLASANPIVISSSQVHKRWQLDQSWLMQRCPASAQVLGHQPNFAFTISYDPSNRL